jgi:hypothetical protein
MDAFLDAALSFPAIVFTFLLVPVVLYWLLVAVGVVDFDLETDIDVDADAEAGDSPSGWFTGWLDALGLAGMPVTVSLSLVVVFGWFIALVATGLANTLDVAAVARVLVGVAVLVLAFVVGGLCAAVAGRPLARLFEVTHAETRRDFVGRTCVIRTRKVTAELGQAEAADPSGATVLLSVRPLPQPAGGGGSTDGSALQYGATALIVDYDREAEVFLVSPLDDELRDAFGTGTSGGA